jgi:hypothetical protein
MNCPLRKSMLFIFVAISIAALPLMASAQTDDNPQCYTVAAAIALNGGDGLQRVRLPLSILQAAQSRDLADVRIVNAEQQTVAFAWAGSADVIESAPQFTTLPQFAWPEERIAETASSANTLHVEVKTDGSVVNITRAGSASGAASTSQSPRWLLDLNALHDHRPTELVVYWKNAGGLVSRANVEASSDAQRWQHVGAATLVQLPNAENQWTTIEQRRIPLQPLDQSMRYLRVSFSDALLLDHIDAKIAGVELPPPMESAKFSAVATEGRTWVLDVGGALVVRRLQIHLAQNNTVLPLQIWQRLTYPGMQPESTWVPVKQTTAYKLLRDGAEITAPAIDINAPAAREWRFTQVGGAASNTGALEITASWIAPQIIFATQGKAPFSVIAGCKNAKPASMDRHALIPGYRERGEYQVAQATVNPIAVQAAAVPLHEEVLYASAESKRRWLLWGVLIVATAGLAWLARKLLRELNASKPGGD